tara:strand:+ start:236 stop:433 length:198 start_codon:yes stop_codon:yes gene_type:complete
MVFLPFYIAARLNFSLLLICMVICRAIEIGLAAGLIFLEYVLSQNGLGLTKRLSTFFVMRETLFL